MGVDLRGGGLQLQNTTPGIPRVRVKTFQFDTVFSYVGAFSDEAWKAGKIRVLQAKNDVQLR
jgi:hypothetical protein